MSDLFVSKLIIPRDVLIREGLLDEYRIHQLVYMLFQDNSLRLLYNLDYGRLGDLAITIQTSQLPNMDSRWPVRTRQVPDSFFNYSNYFFRIKFCPAVKVDGKVAKVHLKETEAIEWLCSREAGYGVSFYVDSMEKQAGGKLVMMPKTKPKITISYVELSGMLKVVDKAKFIDTIIRGIGPSKGFGFGMLQVKPVKEVNK